MNRNIGSADKVVRVAVGGVILGAGIYLKSWWGAIGLIPIVTALVGWCPAYSLIGMQTSGKPQA